MKRLLFLLLVASLPSHAQAVRPAPAPFAPVAPTVPLTPAQPGSGTPGFSPPPPGVPVQPGAQPSTLPRSPNKRVLPATTEPGLWAADGVAQPPTSALRLFDIPLPLPADVDSGVASLAASCVVGLSMAARDTEPHGLLAYPKPVRTCMAAQALYRCALTKRLDGEQEADRRKQPSWRGATSHHKLEALAKAMA